MTHGFDWVLDLFALMERTFPGYGAKPPCRL
jgi:hypothetical protein